MIRPDVKPGRYQRPLSDPAGIIVVADDVHELLRVQTSPRLARTFQGDHAFFPRDRLPAVHTDRRGTPLRLFRPSFDFPPCRISTVMRILHEDRLLWVDLQHLE